LDKKRNVWHALPSVDNCHITSRCRVYKTRSSAFKNRWLPNYTLPNVTH